MKHSKELPRKAPIRTLWSTPEVFKETKIEELASHPREASQGSTLQWNFMTNNDTDIYTDTLTLIFMLTLTLNLTKTHTNTDMYSNRLTHWQSCSYWFTLSLIIMPTLSYSNWHTQIDTYSHYHWCTLTEEHYSYYHSSVHLLCHTDNDTL